MSEYTTWDDEALEATINVMRGMCEDWRKEIERINARMREYEASIREAEAEQTRRALGFGIGDWLAPCAEFTEAMTQRTKLYRAHFMSGGYMTAEEITSDNVLVSNDNGQAWVSIAVARAMRAEWLRRQERKS